MAEKMQAALDWARQSLKERGVFEAEDGLRWAAAHGIVVSVWRNSPVEDAHASRPTSRRKALHDGTMFARNTWLTRQAFDALGSKSRFGFYDLEDLILDRNLVWPGCEGTLTMTLTAGSCSDGPLRSSHLYTWQSEAVHAALGRVE